MQQNVSDRDVWQVTEPEIMDTDRYLSGANAPDFEEDAFLCIDSGARRMIVNCANLGYVTGAGMRALVTVARKMQETGGVLAIANLKGQPRDMFDACGLNAVIPVMESADLDSLTVQAA